MAEIEMEMAEIEQDEFTDGEETVPRRDSSWGAWRYGRASNWSTLYQAGGYANQPHSYLSDMEWFNTVDYYYGLEREMLELNAAIQQHANSNGGR